MAGTTLNDRHLAARVRGKLLKLAEEILDNGTESEKKELLHKMCNGLLPRLTEVTGKDGEAIELKQITGMRILEDGNRFQNGHSTPEGSSESLAE